MTPADPLVLKFWGVRGSAPAPYRENLGFGGNTTCLEVRCGGLPPLIFDAGTGVRRLGHALMREFGPRGDARLFLTHFHWDHIQGLPFFAPLYQPGWRLTFHSALPADALERTLRGQMRSPYFSAESAVQAGRGYEQIRAEGAAFGELVVRPFALSHPDGSTGYRIETPQASVVFACDHEHGDAEADARLREMARGADLLIYDAQYTPTEYEVRKGWGHSTWLAATEVARDAGVKRLALFHHDPEHNDDAVSAILSEARSRFENTLAPREGELVSA